MYFPLQSTQCLSAYLKRAGHETDVAIGSPDEIVDYVRKTKPDLIAFSVLTAYRNHMLAASAAVKEAGLAAPVIAGGYDITFMPQLLENSDLDMICVSEGGPAIVELADALGRGEDFRELETGNLHIKTADGSIRKNPIRSWETNLDKAPYDDREIYLRKDPYFSIVPFTQILAGRGCPHPCTYCFNAGYKQIHVDAGMDPKGYTMLRSVGHVLGELRHLEKTYPNRFFFFNDSTLTWNRKWILDFCEGYRRSGLESTFSLNAVIPELKDDVIDALAGTGKCRLIRFGLETGNEAFRLRTLRKNVKNADLIKTTDTLNRRGLRYSMQMMLGLPGETMEFAWETIELARRITGPTGVHGINIFKPFPGLEINNIGLELGEYRPSDVVAPGSTPPPAWRKDPVGGISTDKREIAGSRGFGTREMVFYDNYRRDRLGLKILRLSRYSHLAIRFPGLRPIIEKIIELPDNAFNRFLWLVTEGLLNIRVHAGAPWSYIFKYLLFHRNKQVR